MENLIKKIDDKLSEIEVIKDRLTELGFDVYDELEMGAPMGNDNAAGSHSGGSAKGKTKRKKKDIFSRLQPRSEDSKAREAHYKSRSAESRGISDYGKAHGIK